MKLKIQEVEKIAKLARLGISEEEKEKFQNQISSILEYVEKLQKVDTKNVESTARVTGLINSVREDEVNPQTRETMEKLIDAAPMKENNLLKTKAIFG